jgi:hypothetical protein
VRRVLGTFAEALRRRFKPDSQEDSDKVNSYLSDASRGEKSGKIQRSGLTVGRGFRTAALNPHLRSNARSILIIRRSRRGRQFQSFCGRCHEDSLLVLQVFFME